MGWNALCRALAFRPTAPEPRPPTMRPHTLLRSSLPALSLLVLAISCRSSATDPSLEEASYSASYPAITIEGTAYDTAMRVALPHEDPEEFDGLHNVFHLSDRIISGSEPHGQPALEQIRDMGVRTIVSVDGKIPDVEAAAELGLRYVHIPTQYKGMSQEELAELAKTFRELDGPFYVHCFHGKHRGPAAAAIGRIVVDGVDRQTAIGEMRQYCGTSPSYEGLYRDVATAYIPTTAETRALDFDFPAEKRPRGVTGVMVSLSRANDNLNLLAKRSFAADPEHPDLDARNEAQKVLQSFEVALTLDEVAGGPRDFHGWFEDAHAGSAALVQALDDAERGDPQALERAGSSWKSVKNACSACHALYRN